MVAGVCAGLADYIGVDPTIVRLLFVLGLFVGGATFWAYLIMMLIVPEK
ncbi:MAG TPA: PspC domain-containing protein [Anaerolineae bacterium]|nr:PspC domain-containing protein [Anaerolineae bacterium]